MDDNQHEQLQQQQQLILSNNIQQQQKQQQPTTMLNKHNLHNFSLNLNNLNSNNNSNHNSITNSGSGSGSNNCNSSNNNKSHQHNMSASVNSSVCNNSNNILNSNSNNINNNNNNSGMEVPHNKNNNANLQNNNSNSNSKNNICNMSNSNNNNNSNSSAGATLKNINNATTTMASTTTTNTNSNSNNNSNSGSSSNGSGKSSPANSIGGGSTNATLNSNNNSNNNINSTNSMGSSTSTSLLLRKQFIASSDASNASFSSASVAGSIQDDMSDQCSLTQAGLEEYNIRASSYYDQPAMLFHHQKQSSYAQSEGYHSYVSSSDSSSATPFLDRLRQESEMLSRQSSHHWSQNDLSSVSCASMAPSPTPLLLSTLGRDATLSGSGGSSNTGGGAQQQHNNSSESTSSTETLKWLGSMSDVSEASHATGYSAISESVSSSQLIVHSSRVLTPKRHHSESVLYLHDEHQQQQSSSSVSPQQQQQHSPNAHVSTAKQISPTLSAREGTHSPPRLTPQTAAALLPNHRHSPSYPPVHTTAAMHPYQPHPQYALRQQPQSLTHKLLSALPHLDSTSQSSLNANSSADSCSLGSVIHSAKTSPTLQGQILNSVSSAAVGDASQSTAAATTSSSSTSVTTTQAADAEAHMAPALQKPAIVPKSASSNAIIEVMAHSPGSANSQLNASNTSLASAVSAAAALPTQSYRSNHRLFPVSTYTEKVHSNTSQFVLHPKPQYSAGLKKPTQHQQQVQKQALQLPLSAAQAAKYMSSPNSPPQPSWQTVAELINDFERTNNEPQPQKYTYMDPGKTQRVSNPALKAFQKNAVQSYFERQQQQQQQNAKEQGPAQKNYQPLSAHTQQHSPIQQQQQQPQQHSPSQTSLHASTTAAHQQLLRPHSYQSNMKETAAQHQIMRSSLPNSYGAQQNHLSGQQLALTQQQLPARQYAPPPPPPPQKPTSSSHGSQDERAMGAANSYSALPTKPPSPAPPPPPPRSRSLMPHTLLRRSSSASDYAEFRDQYTRATQEKLVAQSVKNISNSEKSSFNDCGMPPPPPPPRGARPTNILPTRRTSSAAEYAAAMREKALLQQAAALAHQQHHPHQHAQAPNYAQQYYNPPQPLASCAIESGWVPERPPKNPNLRVPSPDLPPLPPTADLDTQLADEPLPPPPPELLQQQRQQQQQQYYDMNASFNVSADLLPKAPSPNRRNSFAGSSTRKSYFSRSGSEMLSASKVPPLIPKKPSNIETLHAVRQHQQQQQQQHAQQLTAKLLLNGGGMPQPQQHSPPAPPPQTLSAMANATRDAKLSLANRKRPHNPAVSGFTVPPPIMENVPQQPQQQLPSSNAPPNTNTALKSSPPPPPLMPRCMPNQTLMNNSGSNNIKARCNSKASYLPRQSLEKLNNLDPDHGSYKLTLTSNEDLVANTKPAAYDILNTHNGKMPNNLPDVLPLGAKLQPQPASPTSANASPLRYGSNNNLNSTQTVSQQQQQQQQPQPMSPNCYPAYPPTQHRYSTPTMNTYNSNNIGNTTAGKATNYSRSQSYEVHNNSQHSGNLYHHPSHASNSPTKFMSQSTMDLKRTQQLEPTLEETTAALLNESGTVLSPAQSESSLSSPCKRQLPSLSMKPLSSLGNSSDSGSGSTSGSEGRIFRAEVVTATLSTSPIAPVKSVIRKDSLRENIEKITQLQSKLMSAHQSETSLIGIYGSKTALNTTATSVPTTPTTKTENTHAQLTDDSTAGKQASDSSIELALEQTREEEHNSTEHIENNTVDSGSPQPPKSPTNTVSTPTSPTANATLPQPATIVASTNTTTDELTATQTAELNSSTDSLKLMQRSEIVLRVNPATTEAASQTEDDLSAANNDADENTRLTEQPQTKEDTQQQRITLQPRQRHPIEIDCEEMSQELATLLATNEKLVAILAPPTHKSPTDYVSNLYNPNVPLRPAKRDVGTSTLLRMKGHDAQEKVTVELQYAEVEVLLTNGDSESETSDLLKKKVDELMKQLNRKIRILNKEQTTLKAEAELNDELGNSLVGKLTDKVRPIEATKCRTYIDDVGQITSLLLSLSERLARIENSLSTVSAENNAEKKSLELKRDRLLDQLAEAKRLKEDIDRRGSSVVGIVEKTLNADEFADFDYFINMKAKLIADTRDVADKIKCGEEQLNALSEALIQSDC